MTNEKCDSACMSGVNTNGHWKEHRDFGFIVLAGALIGIGAGMFIDYTFSGFLIGLGLGFVASGLIPLVWRPSEGEGLHQQDKNVTLLLIGAFLVFIGVGLVLAPAVIWPYAIAGFLVLLGTWFLIRGFFRVRGDEGFS